MDHPKLAELLDLSKVAYPQIPDVIRAAYALGESAGRAAAVSDLDRVWSAWRTALPPLNLFHKLITEIMTAPPAKPPQATSTTVVTDKDYGAIIRPVRDALRAMSEINGGATVADIVEYMRRWPKAQAIDAKQVGTALKVMARPQRREAVRLSRGHYAPGPNLPAPEAPAEVHAPGTATVN